MIGTDERLFEQALRGYFPNLELPLNANQVPPDFLALDLVEFAYHNVAAPIDNGRHDYYRHNHLGFDPYRGRTEFREAVNLLFIRNGLAFELSENGHVLRMAPPILKELLSERAFRTGDPVLDELLETARLKFVNHDPAIRKEALESLWDGWERLKTVEGGGDKKESTKKLLDKITGEPKFREVIENDAKALTGVGNDFRIRHAEVYKIEIPGSEQVDYVFHRLFALIWLALRKSGRA